MNKKLTPERIADLWSAADAVAQAMPRAKEVPDASWHGSSTIVVHLSEGDDLVLYWPGDGAHPDRRVQRLAGLFAQVLSDR